MNHSETTARNKFQKNKEKSLVDPSGGGETAGTLVFVVVVAVVVVMFVDISWGFIGALIFFLVFVFACVNLNGFVVVDACVVLIASFSCLFPVHVVDVVDVVVVVVVVVVMFVDISRGFIGALIFFVVFFLLVLT